MYDFTDDQSQVISGSISFQMNKERNFLYFIFQNKKRLIVDFLLLCLAFD